MEGQEAGRTPDQRGPFAPPPPPPPSLSVPPPPRASSAPLPPPALPPLPPLPPSGDEPPAPVSVPSRLSTELRFLPVVEPDVPVIEPRLAIGEEPPWSRGRPDDAPAPAPPRPAPVVDVAPQPFREGVTLVPSRALRLVVLVCAAVLVIREGVAAALTVDRRWRGPDVSDRLTDLVIAAFDVARVALALGWVAVTAWSVVAVVNVRRLGGWRVSPVSAVAVLAVPAVVYLNPWFDTRGPGLGWLVPLLLLQIPMYHLRALAKQVGRSVNVSSWFVLTAMWLWCVGRVGDVSFFTEDPDTQVTVSMVVALLAFLLALAWWVTTRGILATADQGAIERARPIDDLSPVFALQQAAAAGVDPNAVLRAVRSAEEDMARRHPVRAEPMGAARWAWVTLTIALTIDGLLVLGPRIADWLDARAVDPGAPLPDAVRTSILVAAAVALVTGVLYVVWGVLVLRTCRRLGEREARPSRWVIGNLIPIVNLFVPYSALRDGTAHSPGAAAAIGRWQATTILSLVISFVAAGVATALDDPTAAAGQTTAVTVANIVGALAPVVSVVVAFASMWQVEQAVRRRAVGDERDDVTRRPD